MSGLTTGEKVTAILALMSFGFAVYLVERAVRKVDRLSEERAKRQAEKLRRLADVGRNSRQQ